MGRQMKKRKWDIKACTIVYSRRYYQILMSNYSKILGMYLSKNKYVNNQRKKFEYSLTSGAWAGH